MLHKYCFPHSNAVFLLQKWVFFFHNNTKRLLRLGFVWVHLQTLSQCFVRCSFAYRLWNCKFTDFFGIRVITLLKAITYDRVMAERCCPTLSNNTANSYKCFVQLFKCIWMRAIFYVPLEMFLSLLYS